MIGDKPTTPHVRPQVPSICVSNEICGGCGTFLGDEHDPPEPHDADCPSHEGPTIKIFVEGGVVQHVDGLPDGYAYTIIDHDEPEAGDDLCDCCGRSGVACYQTDENGTLCTSCANA